MGFKDTLTRRNFLGATATGAVAATGYAQAQKKPAPSSNTKPTSLDVIFKGTELADQTSKEPGDFNLPAAFNDKKCLILFGYNGCPTCQHISRTVAEAQKQLLANNLDVPILVVSAQPTEDKDHVQTYLERYKGMGVQEFADNAALRRQQLVKPLDKSQKNADGEEGKTRIFHIVLPQSGAQTIKIQNRLYEVAKEAGIKKMRDSGTIDGVETQHSFYMTLFDKGTIVDTFRGVDATLQASPTFAKDVAEKITQAVKKLAPTKGRE